jgi:hypothetical protein
MGGAVMLIIAAGSLAEGIVASFYAVLGQFDARKVLYEVRRRRAAGEHTKYSRLSGQRPSQWPTSPGQPQFPRCRTSRTSSS